jgi:DNA adenine methylase
MRYFGGKARHAKQIASILEQLRKPHQPYLEPFCGMGNVGQIMTGERHLSDNHIDLMLFLQEVQAGTFVIPKTITEQQYKALRHAEPSALRGFVGFGLSFAGKWFGGYARRLKGQDDSIVLPEAVNRLRLEGIDLQCRAYSTWQPKDMLVYCDPPYEGTTKIHNHKFDTAEFWSTMRKWRKCNTVIVSEYHAPQDWTCFVEIKTTTCVREKGGGLPRVEKLFR